MPIPTTWIHPRLRFRVCSRPDIQLESAAANFASIGAATVSAALVSRMVKDPEHLEIALGIEAVLLTLFILLFCELGPKALAARYPERNAREDQ